MGRHIRQMCVCGTHSLGVLSVHSVAKLQQGLKLIVPGERDDLQHGAKLTEDLKATVTRQLVALVAAKTNPQLTELVRVAGDAAYLLQDLQCDWVKQILHNDSQDRTLTGTEAPPLAA